MLTKENMKMLRALANKERALFQMGKDGISENMINTVSDSLEAHELVKISLLKTAPIPTKEAAVEMATATRSEIVQVIGHTFVLYRRSKKNKLGL